VAELSKYPAQFCEELVELVTAVCADNSKSSPSLASPSSLGSRGPTEVTVDELLPRLRSSVEFPHLSKCLGSNAEAALLAHLECLKVFNAMVAAALPLVDLSSISATKQGTLAHSLAFKASPLLWPHVKTALWEKALTVSKEDGSSHCCEFDVKRLRSAELATRTSRSDKVLLATVFGQVFTNVDRVPPRKLRLQDTEARLWKVRFVGEGSVDAGGPYRESLSDAVKELHMPHLGLFVPCSNQQAGNRGHVDSSTTIHNMDKFVPSPAAVRPLHARMYCFVGKLMGIALRTKAALPFFFPPLFWKRLCGHPVSRADLKGIDLYLVDYLDVVTKELARPGGSASSFDERFGDRTFVTKSVTGGKQVELGIGGRKRHLSLSNAGEFVERVYEYHLHEFDEQIAHVAEGLATVVPLAPLRLFTANQLELLVCGKSEVDLELLKAKTSYEGDYSADHPTILLFWEMMETFSQVERSAFLKFVWSRDRLPPRAQDFRSNFKITRARGGNEAYPRSHTCFFTVDLPLYTELEAMTEKVKYAIMNCMAIDTDGGANSGGGDDLPEEE